MKKIIISLGTIVALGVMVVGGTAAFFGDTEVSAGNTFTAGAIDLKVDNDSYYNGNRCVNLGTSVPDWRWQGDAPYPVPGTPCTTSFGPSDIDNGLLFLNFTDLKPDDEGEDTISLHVNNNDAYLCMDMSLSSNDDKSSNEPELDTGDAPEDVNNTWDGELGGLLQMVWWVDDGDNVLEIGETLLNGGVKTVLDFFGQDKAFSADLADATTNVWDPQNPGPVSPEKTVYIGKAFCYGTMTTSPLAQDNLGTDGPLAPLRVGTGWSCEGTTLGNESQTDGLTMNIAFQAVQERHNENFTCDEEVRMGTITVTKEVGSVNGGNNVVADFQLFLFDGINTIPVTSGNPTVVPVGNYTVTETGVQGYVASFLGPDCNGVGQMGLDQGENLSCTIRNTDLAPNITLVKSVTGTPPLASPTVFGLQIDGGLVLNNTSVAVTSNVSHTIDEDGLGGYTFVSISGTSNYGQSCPANLGDSITLAEGEAIVCTITNNKN